MATFKPACWVCDNCNYEHPNEADIWDCPGCGLETCEACFSTFAHCQECSAGVADSVLKDHANKKGWDFE